MQAPAPLIAHPAQQAAATPEQTAPPPLTLDDVKALTADSDFSRFALPEVAPEVKNAALKKLFTDPRYNVMDGMDVYVDDYSRPDPVPEAWLRQLATAKFLGLFGDKEGAEGTEEQEPGAQAGGAEVPHRDDADYLAHQNVAESEQAPEAVTDTPPHADPDLRLQQDDAPAGEEPRSEPE